MAGSAALSKSASGVLSGNEWFGRYWHTFHWMAESEGVRYDLTARGEGRDGDGLERESTGVEIATEPRKRSARRGSRVDTIFEMRLGSSGGHMESDKKTATDVEGERELAKSRVRIWVTYLAAIFVFCGGAFLAACGKSPAPAN